jgi:hypothetical protein
VLCVVGEADGNLATSTNPLGAASSWRVTHVDGRRQVTGDSADLSGVACPSVSLCVAVDDAGDVLSSVDPAGGRAAWKLVRLRGLGEASPGYSDVACASVSACFAVENGTILTSTNPTGDSSAWTGGEGFSCWRGV